MPPVVKRNGGAYPVEFKDDGSGTLVQFSAVSGAILIVEDGGGTLELCCVAKPGDVPMPLVNQEAQPATLDVEAGKAFELPHAVYAATYLVVRGANVSGTLCVKG